MYHARRQVSALSLLAFCGPGIYNSLIYDEDEVWTFDSKIHSKDTFKGQSYFLAFLFAIVVLLAYPIGRRVSLRFLIFFGEFTYAIYAVLDTCAMYYGVAWPIVFGNAILGFGSGSFWVSFLSLIVAYSSKIDLGKHIAIYCLFHQSGDILGFSLDFLVIMNPELNPYQVNWTIMAIVVSGVLISTFVIAPPQKVVRMDNLRVAEIRPSHGTRMTCLFSDIREGLEAFTDPFALKLAIYFCYANWPDVLCFAYLNGTFFTRATASGIGVTYSLSSIITAQVLKFVMDNQKMSIKKRARTLILINVFLFCFAWSCALYLVYGMFNGQVDRQLDRYDPNMNAQYSAGIVYEFNNGTLEVTGAYEDDPKLINNLAWFPGHQRSLTTDEVILDGCEWLKDTRDYYRSMVDDIFLPDGSLDDDAMRLACMGLNMYEMTPQYVQMYAICMWDINQCVDRDAEKKEYGRTYVDIGIFMNQNPLLCDMHQKELCIELMSQNNYDAWFPIFTFILMGLMKGAFNVIPLWLIGIKTQGSLCLAIKYVAVYLTFRSIGIICSWAADSQPDFLYRYQLIVNVIVGGLGLFGASCASNDVETLSSLHNQEYEHDKSDFEPSSRHSHLRDMFV